jgi:hypothetical protein
MQKVSSLDQREVETLLAVGLGGVLGETRGEEKGQAPQCVSPAAANSVPTAPPPIELKTNTPHGAKHSLRALQAACCADPVCP